MAQTIVNRKAVKTKRPLTTKVKGLSKEIQSWMRVTTDNCESISEMSKKIASLERILNEFDQELELLRDYAIQIDHRNTRMAKPPPKLSRLSRLWLWILTIVTNGGPHKLH